MAENESENGEEKELENEELESEESAETPDLQKELEAAQKEVLYQKAEFDNYRKRILREQDQAIKFANERLVRELPTIVDLLERGLNHGKKISAKGTPIEAEFQSFLSGIDMTHRELIQLLGRFGVEFVGKAGDKFDPNLHEAVSQLETTEDKAETVLEVMQKGCLFHGRLLTPARVIVGIAKQG